MDGAGLPVDGSGGAGDADAAVPGALWCSRCGRQVTGGARPVHAGDGSAFGPDGHRVEPVAAEPPLWKAAREIEARYGGLFTVSARFGFLRADWTARALGPGMVAVHYEAHDEDEMRRQLDAAVAGTRRSGAGIRP